MNYPYFLTLFQVSIRDAEQLGLLLRVIYFLWEQNSAVRRNASQNHIQCQLSVRSPVRVGVIYFACTVQFLSLPSL